MFFLQQGQHRFLCVLRRPAADAIGQRNRGLAHDDAQTLFQRKDAGQADAGVARLLTNPPQRDDAEQRGDAAAPWRHRPTAIDMVVVVN